MWKRSVPLLAATGFVWLIAACVPVPSGGDIDNIRPTANYGGGRTSCQVSGNAFQREICLQDDANVSVYLGNISSSGLRNALLATLDDLETTDLTVSTTNSPEYSAYDNAETDIVYWVDNNMNLGAGLTWCEDEDDGTRCDQHYIVFDQGEYCAGLSPANCADPAEIQRITCHETGHAVGLTHGTQSSPSVGNLDSRLGCLKSPSGSGQNYQAVPRFLQAMNKRNINRAY